MTQPDLFNQPTHEPVENPVRAERQRLTANARRLLEQLKRGPLLTHELHDPRWGTSGDRRLREIRADGWTVVKERISKGSFRYTLRLPLTL